MRTQARLDRELEQLAGTELKKVDLVKASEDSDSSMLLNTLHRQLGELFEVFPNVKEQFITEGVEWYKERNQRKTIAQLLETVFKSSG